MTAEGRRPASGSPRSGPRAGEIQSRETRRDEALSRDQRLRRAAEIQSVMSGGSRGVSTCVVALCAVPGGRGASPRVGVVASRKVGGAVARSRAKRLLREAYRRAPSRPAGDLVLIARRGIGVAPWKSVVLACREATREAERKAMRKAARASRSGQRP